MFWTAFERISLPGAALENVGLEPAEALRARLVDPSRPGRLTTAPIRLGPFDRAIVSWNGTTPPGSRFELELRAEGPDKWTSFYPLAVWSGELDGPRSSCPGHEDGDGRIDTDVLKLVRPARALQIRVTFQPGASGPVLTGLAALLADSSQAPAIADSPCGLPGLVLDVPTRSQLAFPEGARSWCSPTSMTMLLEYWGRRLGRPLADPVPAAARLTWDSAYDGAGNWPFNTAYASTKGLRAFVTRLTSLAGAEVFLRREMPLALSIGWRDGELPGAPLPASSGHLVVLCGFDASGNPVV
ncbi:MAG TPA: C39 family peptidase, partial [Holophaga sp.]|nr:C39 family peptidase [Holophaga sp.]